MKNSILIALLLTAYLGAQAQISISTGDHILEISGRTSIYYNQRFLKPGENNNSNNRFKLRDAIIDIEGRNKDIWEYRIQADIADIAAGTTDDPENPGLMDASVTYKGLRFLNIKAGYGKVPYSVMAMTPFNQSPYWQRAQLVRGDLFSRRDIGITLSSSLWEDKVGLYTGAYTGLGELSLKGDNDASGALEYVARVDLSYPIASKNRQIDYVHSPIPIFTLGLNGRYANKKLPEGRSFPEGTMGTYDLRVIDGQKYTYGLDFSFQYQGFSGQFEIHQIKAKPQNPQDPLFQGYNATQNEGFFYAGGLVAQLNYHILPSRTSVSVRYEQLDLNDLVPGRSERFSAAAEQRLKMVNAAIKMQYFSIIKEESIDPLRWNEQVRIGLVFDF